MSINLEFDKVIDGDAGGTIAASDGLSPDLKAVQFAISGRATGTIAVKVKPRGSDFFQEFETPIALDLATDRVARVNYFAIDELEFTPSAAGSDFTVTVVQWPN